MKHSTARTLLLHQLAATTRLPEALLRGAATFTAADTAIAAALAARIDLPNDLRAAAAADNRAAVRAAYVSRSDISTDELETLLATETRSDVLVALADTHAEHDPVALHLLWQRLLAKPTKALAVALLSSAARSVDARRRAVVPAPPSRVVAAMLAALGAKFSGNRWQTRDLDTVGMWLAAAGDQAAAEAVARCSTAPLTVRARLAQLTHLSAAARCALIDDALIGYLFASTITRSASAKSTPAEFRVSYLPARTDVLTTMLTSPDVQPAVIAHMRSILNTGALVSRLPDPWVELWESQLAAYTPAACTECQPDGTPLPDWDAAILPIRQRQPNTNPEPGSAAASTPRPAAVPSEDTETASADTDTDLDALDDYSLSDAVAALPAHLLPEVAARAVSRESTVIACALFDRPDFAEADAVTLLGEPWCRPAGEVLVRLVGLRAGQSGFALAAAGHAPAEVVRAYGTTVFAAAASADAALDGGRAFAAAVGDALRGRPLPGWQQWAEPRERDNRVGDLAALAERADVPDEVLLALPWNVLHAVALTRRWPWEETNRVRQALADALAARLGDDPGRWNVYASLSDTWAGSLTELLDVCRATTLPAVT